MKIEKVYLNRHYDQWQGKIIYTEDEVDGYGVTVCMPDAEMSRGSVNVITADFRDIEGNTYTVMCTIEDYLNKVFRFQLPLKMLSNDGEYQVVFTISYNSNGTDGEVSKTAIQTFSVIDTIEVSDEDILDSEDYPILADLIKELAQYKVDTSSFPTFNEVKKLIDENLDGISIDTIMEKLDKKGYALMSEVEQLLMKNYVSKFDSAQFAKTTDLNKYVMKELGKGLSSNDFTNALKDKLIKLSENNNEGGKDYDDTELRELIDDITSDLQRNYYSKTISDERYLRKQDVNLSVEDIKYEKDGYGKLSDVLEELTYKYPQIMTFNCSLDKLVYERNVDSVNSIVFNWSTNKVMKQLVLNNIEIFPTQTAYVYNQNITDTTTFVLSVTDGQHNDSKIINIQFVYPIYYGASSDNITENTILSSNKLIEIKEDKKINISYEDKKVFFCYPISYGKLIAIKDNNGFNYINSFDYNIIEINGINYYLYSTQEHASVKNMTYEFKF